MSAYPHDDTTCFDPVQTSDIISGATDWAARNLRGLGNTINAAVPPQMLQSPWQQELGPEGVASMGKEYEGPSLGQPFRLAGERVAKTSAEYSARGLDPGFLKDALHTVGATVPALLLRHPALIGFSGALESMAGDPDVQRAVMEGVKSGAAVALMSGAANLIGETGMGALPRFFARTSANVVIPAIMNGRVPTLQDLAFATGFALMHGGPQDEQAIRQRAARLVEVATDPERHPDIQQSLQDIAEVKFDEPRVAPVASDYTEQGPAQQVSAPPPPESPDQLAGRIADREVETDEGLRPPLLLSAARETALTREEVADFGGAGWERGLAHNQHLAEWTGGGRERRVETALGRRIHDVHVPTGTVTQMAFEGKNYLKWRSIGGAKVRGEVPLTSEIRRQIYKDVLWRREGRVQGVHRVVQWDFPGAPPSQALKKFLERWGFPYGQ